MAGRGCEADHAEGRRSSKMRDEIKAVEALYKTANRLAHEGQYQQKETKRYHYDTEGAGNGSGACVDSGEIQKHPDGAKAIRVLGTTL